MRFSCASLFGCVGWAVLFLASQFSLAAQQTSLPALPGNQVVERVSPAVVLVLAGSGAQEISAIGSGLIVRSDGVILTTYHAVKGAHAVRVQLKNGELFDRVELVAVDERRDIAALRITATGLPTVPTVGLAEVQAGEQIYVLSHAKSLNWTASDGIVSAVRLADEVPGAGKGYRVVQFTAPVSPGASGGVLVDAKGRGLGIVVGTVSGGQNLNFAVPLESVLGLAQVSGGTPFANGTDLRPPTPEPMTPAPEPIPMRPRGPEVFGGNAPAVQPVNPSGSELSRPIESRDPMQLLRTFRTIYIVSKTVWLKQDLMQQALNKEPALTAWGVAIVSDPQVADVRLSVDRVLFTWTWTYELVHQNTGIVLGTGKYNAIAGGAGADKIAQAIVSRIAEARGLPTATVEPKKK